MMVFEFGLSGMLVYIEVYQVLRQYTPLETAENIYSFIFFPV